MSARLWIGTSWKMHKLRADALAYCRALRAARPPPSTQLFVIPPHTVLRDVSTALQDTGILVGAQNMHWADHGAWTGEISAPMLEDCGARLVEIGHSERRQHFGEDDRTVALKVAAAMRHGLTALICIGETQAERDAGRTATVLETQVSAALTDVAPNDASRIVFAYEPVWAIGDAGKPARPDDVARQHTLIKRVAAAKLGQAPRVLYGGSVRLDNGREFVAHEDVDGLFIGRAAWDVEGYLAIVESCVQR